MSAAPNIIGGAAVVLFSVIDGRHRHTGHCRHFVNGKLTGPAAGLAICQYVGDASYYLYGCDENWVCVTDSWFETIEDAKQQAEYEYAGVTQTWQEP